MDYNYKRNKMIIPVRCFTCGKVSSTLVLTSCQIMGNKWNKYLDLIDKEGVSTA